MCLNFTKERSWRRGVEKSKQILGSKNWDVQAPFVTNNISTLSYWTAFQFLVFEHLSFGAHKVYMKIEITLIVARFYPEQDIWVLEKEFWR